MVAPLIAAAVIGSAGLSAVGKILGGIGKKSAAKRLAQQLEYAAQLDLREAGLEAQLGLEEDERVAASLATYAAQGVGGGLRGSAQAVLADLGRQSLNKARLTAYRGDTAAWARRNDVKQVKFEGSQALTGGILGAGSTLLGAAAQLYGAGGR